MCGRRPQSQRTVAMSVQKTGYARSSWLRLTCPKPRVAPASLSRSTTRGYGYLAPQG